VEFTGKISSLYVPGLKRLFLFWLVQYVHQIIDQDIFRHSSLDLNCFVDNCLRNAVYLILVGKFWEFVGFDRIGGNPGAGDS